MSDQRAPAIPFEEVARYPLPGWIAPSSIAFSPDDSVITYLFSPNADLTLQLYRYDPATGESALMAEASGAGVTEENLSLEEKLRRERARELGQGISRYAWAKKADRLLIPLPDGLYLQDGVDAPLRRVLDTSTAPAIDPQLSPDGRWIAYVQDDELYVISAEGGAPRQITHGARGTGRTHGLAEFVAQEEMHRSHGFWWSPDGEWLAFVEVDETPIPYFRILHQGKASTGPDAQEEHRYPFAGEANARVRLGIVSREGGAPMWMDLGDDEDIYLARVQWLPDGTLTAQIQNREQTILDLVCFDPQTGQRTPLLREQSDIWINLHDILWPLITPAWEDHFVWASERRGFRHLYLYNRNGEIIRALTGGDWMVDALVGVDEERGAVYFTASLDTPLESHLYAVPLSGGEPRRLTHTAGMHAVVMDHRCRRFVDTVSALDRPPTVTLHRVDDGALLDVIFDRPDPRLAQFDLQPPELVSLSSPEGITLYGLLFRPPAEFGPGPYPTLISVYGGPGPQMISNSWGPTSSLRAQSLSRQGFLVFALDNRGSARRGLAFEGAIKHRMGSVEVEDQATGVRWLIDQGLADPERVGIYGWSYGGYMSLMCLACAPQIFKVAVAGAPVTHWEGYDTHYTERYMGTPQSNPAGYAAGSVLTHVEGMTGKLMLVHGLIDENVHFRHTARLINSLIAARKPYDLLLFPDERHLPRSLADRVFMEEEIYNFLSMHLASPK
ncbi:MAG: S9 family peptidase [Caldilineaceae bacterium]|nr:S9 family peptidase [Caldilineaceae bacterium]